MIRAGVISALCVALAVPVWAEAPASSPVPPTRPGDAPTVLPLVSVPVTRAAPSDTPRPKPRPVAGPGAVQTPVTPPKPADPVGQFLSNVFSGNANRKPTDTQVVQQTAAASMTSLAVARSAIPRARPENLLRKNTVQRTGLAALFGQPNKRTTAQGSVCGVNEIKGVRLQSIPGKVAGCGIAEPVKVTSVAGVSLSAPITVECSTAVALDKWVKTSVIPTVGRLGGGVSGLYIMASYACRPRNNQKGAKISEHGRGRAVDVGGIILANGEQLSVLDDWRSSHGAVMKAMHGQACGTFGTVLGPNADRFHQNHFHFDTASYRSGAYCR